MEISKGIVSQEGGQNWENHPSFIDEGIVTWDSFLTCRANTTRKCQWWGSNLNVSSAKDFARLHTMLPL